MDALEALRTRRSVGKLTGDVSDADVRELIACAVAAPNHKLTQPWRFTILRGGARERLGAAWSRIVEAGDVPPGVDRAAFVAKEAAKPTRAPVLIVASTRTDDDPIRAIEDFAATAAAVTNLLVAAHAKGFGAIWRTGDMAYRAEIREHLGLDPTDRIVAIVYLGLPAIVPPPRMPPDLSSVVRVES